MRKPIGVKRKWFLIRKLANVDANQRDDNDVVFIVLLVGTSLAVSNIWAFGDVPGWLYSAIAVANLLAIAALFGALWKTPHAQT